jgi:tetratricopeptide (TPR) repeat protein
MRDRAGFCLTILLGLAPGLAAGQAVDRGKVEVEAAGQAAEADRLFKRGEWEPAIALYEAERASRAALGDIRYEAYALRAIGICRAELGDDEGAIDALAEARKLDIKREDKGYAGYDLFLIAQCELRLERAQDAIRTLEAALPLLSTAVDRDHEADARLVLTRTLATLGRSEDARPHVARAIALAEGLNDAWRLADSWASSGQVEGALGNASLALERFADAQELFEEQGRAAESAWMETVSGSTLLLMGRSDLALARFEEAARLHEHLDDGGSTSEDLAAVAGLHLEAGRIEEALQAARRAVVKAQEVDDRPREVDARVRLAQVQGRKDDWIAAATTLDEAVSLIRQVARDNPADQVRLLLTTAYADQRAGQVPRSRERLEAARKVAQDAKQPDLKRIVDDARRQFDGQDKVPNAPQPHPR